MGKRGYKHLLSAFFLRYNRTGWKYALLKRQSNLEQMDLDFTKWTQILYMFLNNTMHPYIGPFLQIEKKYNSILLLF